MRILSAALKQRTIILNSKFRLLLAILSGASPLLSFAVDATIDPLQFPKFDESQIEIRIDGVLDESIWESVPFYDNLTIIEPDTLEDAPLETKIRYFYTSKGLYVGVWNEQDQDTLVSR